jgi:hypothetical protein
LGILAVRPSVAEGGSSHGRQEVGETYPSAFWVRNEDNVEIKGAVEEWDLRACSRTRQLQPLGRDASYVAFQQLQTD